MEQVEQNPMKTTTMRVNGKQYVVGKVGVAKLVANPPMYGVIYEDGRETLYCCPNESVEWTNEPQRIVVPELVMEGA